MNIVGVKARLQQIWNKHVDFFFRSLKMKVTRQGAGEVNGLAVKSTGILPDHQRLIPSTNMVTHNSL